MGDAGGKVITKSPQSHSIHGIIDRGSSQPTSNSPTSGALYTLQQKENQQHNSPTKPRSTTHNPNPNSATTTSAWCCSSERHPTPSLLLDQFHCLQTHPSGEHVRRGKSRCDEVGPKTGAQHTKQRERGQNAELPHPSGILLSTHFNTWNERRKTHTSR
jgi:hypothetical protein